MGVRGSIWSSVFMVGAGGPGGVRLPCPNARSNATNKQADPQRIGDHVLIRLAAADWPPTRFRKPICDLPFFIKTSAYPKAKTWQEVAFCSFFWKKLASHEFHYASCSCS